MLSLLQRRRAMMRQSPGGGGRLPSGYIEVSYIEASGTQYILTNIKPRNTKTEGDIQFGNVASSTDGAIAQKYDSNQRYYTLHKDNVNRLRFSNRGNTPKWTQTFDTDRHTFVFNDADHNSYVDGDYKANDATFACSSGNTPLGLFCRNAPNGPEKITPGKIYYLKFTDNDTGDVLGEFIPCVRTSDSKAGLFDLATNTYYGNSGSGEFTAGPIVT